MTTTDSSTLHNHIVASSQENLQEQDKANSMPTQAPKGEPQNFIVQSSPEESDAHAEAETFIYEGITYNRKYFAKLPPLKEEEKELGVKRGYNIFIPEEIVYPSCV